MCAQYSRQNRFNRYSVTCNLLFLEGKCARVVREFSRPDEIFFLSSVSTTWKESARLEGTSTSFQLSSRCFSRPDEREQGLGLEKRLSRQSHEAPEIQIGQCDEIWRNFTTLAIYSKFLLFGKSCQILIQKQISFKTNIVFEIPIAGINPRLDFKIRRKPYRHVHTNKADLINLSDVSVQF